MPGLKIVRSLKQACTAIEGNCGPDARRLLSEHRALTPETIKSLSRTSPEYQQHVLDRIRAGHARPLHKTAACALVYETVSFREVISRLERALGIVGREVAFVTSKVVAGAPSLDRGPDRLLTLALVAETAKEITAGLHKLHVVGDAQAAEEGPRHGNQERAPAVSERLHAAGALGLLAKNCRNLPMLKPEHLPTAVEGAQAFALCRQIVALAQRALRPAHKKWGNLESQLRVRPRGAVTRRIITHSDPDGNAVVAAWLAERFLFDDEAVEILFVPRKRVLGCLRIGDCLVDVGNAFDPAKYLYDDKPPALPSRHDSCAAKLVWDHLLASGRPVQHLEELVLVVFGWDSTKRRQEFERHVIASKQNGFHAALDAAMQRGLNNAALYRHLRRWLDRAYSDGGGARSHGNI